MNLWMPHGHCYLWSPGILWPSVTYDALIALSYFTIPLLIARRRRLPTEGWAGHLFIAFILLCGLTHVMDIITVFTPLYEYQNIVKGLTAGVSLSTAWAMAYGKSRHPTNHH